MTPIYQNAPALLDYLQTTSVELHLADEDTLRWSGDRELNASEVRAIRSRKPQLLECLRARESRGVGQREAVLPALRAYLSENPHTAHFEPEYVAENLYLQGYLSYRPDTGNVAGALEGLRIEGEVLA